MMQWVKGLAALGALRGVIDKLALVGPVGAIIAPVLGAIGDAIAAFIRMWLDGIAVVFKNPVAFTVVFSAMAYGYYEGHKRVSLKYNETRAEFVKLQKAKKCTAPAVAPSDLYNSWGIPRFWE